MWIASSARGGAYDRERHLYLYLRFRGPDGARRKGRAAFRPGAAPAGEDRGGRPGATCALRFVADHFADVVRADVLDLPFESESFDLVIASHVLEHVADDRKAVAEIRRVLKIGGQAVLQTPFSATLAHTWEDGGVDTPAARTEAYGQDDHVRLYGRDIFERIGAGGLASRISSHDELLADFEGERFGINTAEPFFLFQRER